MTAESPSRRRSNLMIEWLQTKGPDEWHRTATCWNWDLGLDVLHWIVTQPECDKATALTVFWVGAPESHVLPPAENSWSKVPGFAEAHALLTAILQNWKAGFYKRSRFAYAFTADWYRLPQDNLELRLVQAAIPPDMARDLPGEQVSAPDHIEGFAPDAVVYLEARGVQI